MDTPGILARGGACCTWGRTRRPGSINTKETTMTSTKPQEHTLPQESSEERWLTQVVITIELEQEVKEAVFQRVQTAVLNALSEHDEALADAVSGALPRSETLNFEMRFQRLEDVDYLAIP
jgi:predicted ATP-dependent protease